MKDRRNGKEKATGKNRRGRKPSGGRAKRDRVIREVEGAQPVSSPEVGVADAPGLAADGRRAKGRRVANPDAANSVSAAKNGVTTALFVHMTPEERRCLDHMHESWGLSRGIIIRSLICRTHALMVDGKVTRDDFAA